jgi:NADH-quinone oxidoreductase subunit L
VRSMTFPLVVLAGFAVAAGWVGIPEGFPVIGGLIPNWFHAFIGGTLLEHPETIAFNVFPLLTSVGVALGGLLIGYVVYRKVRAGAVDPLRKPLGLVYTLLENKYYFDEFYQVAFIKPAYWFAETFTYRWIDRGLIDGFLHFIGRTSLRLGAFLRSYIDMPIVNGAGDLVGEGTKRIGRTIRVIQTGRVQEYLIIGIVFTGIVLSYFLVFKP